VEIRTPDLLRPRQARYQAALRPDSEVHIHSKALSNLAPVLRVAFTPDSARTVHENAIAPLLYTLAPPSEYQLLPVPFRWLDD
jgi:hypothetical protein